MGIGTMLNNAALHYHLLILPSPNWFLGPQNFKAALYYMSTLQSTKHMVGCSANHPAPITTVNIKETVLVSETSVTL